MMMRDNLGLCLLFSVQLIGDPDAGDVSSLIAFSYYFDIYKFWNCTMN